MCVCVCVCVLGTRSLIYIGVCVCVLGTRSLNNKSVSISLRSFLAREIMILVVELGVI